MLRPVFIDSPLKCCPVNLLLKPVVRRQKHEECLTDLSSVAYLPHQLLIVVRDDRALNTIGRVGSTRTDCGRFCSNPLHEEGKGGRERRSLQPSSQSSNSPQRARVEDSPLDKELDGVVPFNGAWLRRLHQSVYSPSSNCGNCQRPGVVKDRLMEVANSAKGASITAG